MKVDYYKIEDFIRFIANEVVLKETVQELNSNYKMRKFVEQYNKCNELIYYKINKLLVNNPEVINAALTILEDNIKSNEKKGLKKEYAKNKLIYDTITNYIDIIMAKRNYSK